jgi:hypothetical protein
MERRGNNTWLIAALAVAVGFLIAVLIFNGNDNKNSSATVSSTTATATTTAAQAGTTTATSTATTVIPQGAAPQDPQPSVGACINLWNEATNRGDQTLLVNFMVHQPVRVHVGVTSDVPPKCEVTVVGNDGNAWVFPEGGGTTYPYVQSPSQTQASTLAAAQKISNALEQRDGTLTAR